MDSEDPPQDTEMKEEDDSPLESTEHRFMHAVEDAFDSDPGEPMEVDSPSGRIVQSSTTNNLQQIPLPQSAFNLLYQRSVSEESVDTTEAREFLLGHRSLLSKIEQRHLNRDLWKLQRSLRDSRKQAIKKMHQNLIRHPSLYVAFGRTPSKSARRHCIEVTSMTPTGYDLATRTASIEVAKMAHVDRKKDNVIHESSITTVLFKPPHEFDNHFRMLWIINGSPSEIPLRLNGPIYGYRVELGPFASTCIHHKILIREVSFIVRNGEAHHLIEQTLKFDYITKFPLAVSLIFDLGPATSRPKSSSSRCSSVEGEGVRNLFEIEKSIKKDKKKKKPRKPRTAQALLFPIP